MKKLFSILSLIMILFGSSCNESPGLLMNELTNKNGLMYNNGELYTGKVWDIYSNDLWNKFDYRSNEFEPPYNDDLEQGQIGYNGFYKNGKRHGTWEYYFPDTENGNSDGFVRYKETYKKGEIEEVLVWDKMGEKLRKEKYKDGIRHGIWIFYVGQIRNDDGDMGDGIIKVNYKNGLVVFWTEKIIDGKPDPNGLPTVVQDIQLFVNGKESRLSDIIIGGQSLHGGFGFEDGTQCLEGESLLR